MNIKKTDSTADTLLGAIDAIQRTMKVSGGVKKQANTAIADIITFCNSQHLLNLPGSNFHLFMSQRVILKAFYIGTMGNENLKIDQEEWIWLHSNEENEVKDEIEYEKNVKDVIRKLLSKERGENKSEYFQILHLVLGRRSSKCHEENQIIATTSGSMTFRELCDRYNKGEKIGICTYDPKTLKRSVTYNIKLQDNGNVKCFEIKTSRGKKETVSWNHPYLIWRKEWDKPQFVKVMDVKPGDRIATAKCTELFGQGGIGVNKAALLGYLANDGKFTDKIMYVTEYPDTLEDLRRILKEEFPGYDLHLEREGYYRIAKDVGDRYGYDYRDDELREFLSKEGVCNRFARDMSVPPSILAGSKEEVVAFISRLFSSNTNAYPDKKEENCNDKTDMSALRITFKTTSDYLANGLQHLLLKFNINSYIVSREYRYERINNENYHFERIDKKVYLYICGLNCLERFRDEINIYLREDIVQRVIDIVQKESPVNVDVRKRSLPTEKMGKGYLRNTEKMDVNWEIVKEVNPVGKKNTVALEVKKTHIIGSDIISHNTVMASLITAYEAYKVLIVNDGNPHEYFNLPYDDTIAIINVALSQDQAGRLFEQIKNRIRNSPFFKGRIAKETTSEIRLYTDSDLQKKRDGSTVSVDGSVLLLCGHSNPDSLAGYNAILILFDEIAFYDEKGQVTGSYFYQRLKASIAKFYKYKAARIVMISSPNKRNGIFFDVYTRSKSDDSILSFQLPTWCVNPDVTYDNEDLARDREINPEVFATEFGAQFSTGGSFGNYFEEGLINRCIRGDIGPHLRPKPHLNYYLHVDPSKGVNNYSAVLVAKERYLSPQGRWRNRLYLAGAWIWKPSPGIGIEFSKVDKEVLNICAVFRPVLITYDDFQSEHSMQLIKTAGFNVRLLSYNRGIKQKIYQNLKELMAWQPESELFLYDDGGNSSMLIGEMRNLKFKKIPRGISLVVDKQADVKTDDLVDALAGACCNANETMRMGLPMTTTVKTGWR